MPAELAELAKIGISHPRFVFVLEAVAANECTPPETLDELARVRLADNREYFRGLVAENRSTPPDALRFLARRPRYYSRVMSNPGAGFSLLIELAVAYPSRGVHELVRNTGLTDAQAIAACRRLGRDPKRYRRTARALHAGV